MADHSSWHVGFYIPPSFLEYLIQTQHDIQDISLVTSEFIPGEDVFTRLLSSGLGAEDRILMHGSLDPCAPTVETLAGKLSHVRSLRWEALNSRRDLLAVKAFIAHHSASIQDLSMGLLRWSDAQKAWSEEPDRSSNFLATDVFGILPGAYKNLFPRLRTLLFANVLFGSFAEEMTKAFNFRELESLKLRDCVDVTCLLDALTRLDHLPHLRSLEIAWPTPEERGDASRDMEDLALIHKLFAKMYDLKDAFFQIHDSGDAPLYWFMLLKFKATIERFVWSETSFCLDADSPLFESRTACEIRWRPAMGELLFAPFLRCVGLSCEPRTVVSDDYCILIWNYFDPSQHRWTD